MKVLEVKASRNYNIVIDNGIIDEAGKYIKEVIGEASAVIVSDDNVFPIYGSRVKRSLEEQGYKTCEFVFPHGERSKNLGTYGELLEFMCKRRITRKDFIVALGGGVVGDLAGFAAATYQRGIRFVQIPTTLLADVDSSVGGKTAVDLANGKNQVGCFYQPSLVLCDPMTINTLPEEEFRCGCAEVIKYAIIGDKELYDNLMKKDAYEQLEYVIATCAGMKRDIVERDEFDTGERMLLNLGHSFGHAVEYCSNFSILHGQAVAIGLATMVKSANALGYCNDDTVSMVIDILEKYNLPTKVPYSLNEVAEAVLTDKKMAGSTMRVVVPKKIGECIVESVPADEIKNWLIKGGVA